MARQFRHIEITFQRTVTQQQAVDVAVPPELPDPQAQEYAAVMATARVKDKGWGDINATEPEIVE
jgi:hypothetical protein